jgi:hypothetical protein
MLKFSLYAGKFMEIFSFVISYIGKRSFIEHIIMNKDYTLQRDVPDILFTNRNKAYGAYALRMNYPARLKTPRSGKTGP